MGRTREKHTESPQALKLPREPYHEFLAVADIRVLRVACRLRLTMRSTCPDHYIGLHDGKDRVIGIVRDLEKVDPESRSLISEDLARRYFAPNIEKIITMKEEFGVHYCTVVTDHGDRNLIIKGIRDQMLALDDGGFLLTDTDGNRYRLQDWTRMDARSRRLIEQFV